MSQIRLSFEHLLRDESGTSLIELAIAAPVLIMLIIGVTDLSLNYSARFDLQSALTSVRESAQQGAVSGGYQHLRAEAASAAAIPLENVILEEYLECNGKKVDSKTPCAEGEMAVKYIRLDIFKSYKPIFGRMGYSAVGPDGTLIVKAGFSLRVDI